VVGSSNAVGAVDAVDSVDSVDSIDSIDSIVFHNRLKYYPLFARRLGYIPDAEKICRLGDGW